MFINQKNTKYEVLSMSLSNSITKLLNFKENNLIFNENFLKVEQSKIKNVPLLKDIYLIIMNIVQIVVV